jgi:molybdate transport system ATP-binding protein
LIAGLTRPEAGRVVLRGETLFDSEARIEQPLRTRRVSMIFQDDLLFPHLSVARNVAFGLVEMGRREARRRVGEVAELCGIAGLLERRPETLSGGERQRVGLARAIAPRPRLLLCDEPFAALDLKARDALIATLKSVRGAESTPMLHVTHSTAEAVAVGSRVFLVRCGRVVDEGEPLDVLSRAEGVRFEGLSNAFDAVVVEQSGTTRETIVRIENGPELVAPRLDRPVGAAVRVVVGADDLMLARGGISGVSARNAVPAEVVRVVVHGDEAEVIVRTLGVEWIVSVVAPAAAALGLSPGVGATMIVKARSLRIADR